MKYLFTTLFIISVIEYNVDAANRYSVNNGDWDNTNTWATSSGGSSGASVPGSGDVVIIEDEYTVTVNSVEQCDSIYIISGSGNDSKLLVDDDGDLTVTNGVFLTTENNGNKATLEIFGTSGTPGTMSIGGDLIIRGFDGEDDAEVNVIDDGSLTVSGDVFLWTDGDKKAEFNVENDATAIVVGDIIFEGAELGKPRLRVKDNAVLNIAGNFDRSASGNYGELDCELNTVVNYNGSSAQTLSMIDYGGSATDVWTYGEVRINNTAGVTLDADISQSDVNNTVLDDIRILSGQMNSGGYSIELGNGKVFEIASATTYYTTTTDATGGMLETSTSASHDIHVNSMVNFAATSAQNVPDPSNSEPYGNVTMSGGATKTLVDNIDVNGDLLITATSTLDADNGNDYDIDLAGNWTDNGTYNERNGKVTFDGSSAQTINGVNETYYDLTINNSSGDVSLNTDITVSRTLDLTLGDIVLGSNDMTMDVNATSSNESASSYVQADNAGVMIKNMDALNNPFNYPVGDNNEYSPFWVELIGGTTFGGSDFISVNIIDSKHVQINPGTAHITRVWNVNSGGFSAINFTYKSVYVDADIVGSESNLLGIRWDGSAWTSYNSVSASTNTLSNTTGISEIPANDGFTGGGAGAILPIELLGFNAEVVGSEVLLTWSTAVEINNDYFTIERSNDGIDFEILVTIEGQGTTYQSTDYKYVDVSPYQGTSYYRLKQADYDHHFEYFAPVTVVLEYSNNTSIELYPNPVLPNQSLNVVLEGFEPYKEVVVLLMDQFGREVFSKVIMMESSQVLTAIDLYGKIPPGLYFVIGSDERTIHKKRLIISSSSNSSSN